jgi:hypothetical protein
MSLCCRYAERRYVQCQDHLNVLLSVVMLNVVMLSVVAPTILHAMFRGHIFSHVQPFYD